MAYTIKGRFRNDRGLNNNLNNIITNTTETHKTRFLYSFTDHGISHSERMINTLESLLHANGLVRTLNAYEAFILLAAIYLHDIGIQLSNYNQLCRFAQSNRLNIPPSNSEELKIFIRNNHHLLSAYWIELNIEPNCRQEIAKAYVGDPQLGEIVAKVVRSHGEKIESIMAQDDIDVDGQTIRVKFLCILLCLADVLDCGRQRIEPDLSDLSYRELVPIARLHRMKHYYVQSLSIQRTLINIYFRFPDLEETEKEVYKLFFTELTIMWLNRIHDECEAYLNTVGLMYNIHEYYDYNVFQSKVCEEDYDYMEKQVFDMQRANSKLAFQSIAIGIVVHNESVLMVKRHNPEGDLVWQFPAGHIRLGEDPGDAAIREVIEETSIVSTKEEELHYRIHPLTKVFCYYYALEYQSGYPQNMQEHENDETAWVALKEWQQVLTSNIANPVRAYLDRKASGTQTS